MCGIVGTIGQKEALPILFNSLKRLEYRGYDSAGVAMISPDNKLIFHKKEGKISQLENSIERSHFTGTLGISHTRWATHGEPNTINAHPHLDCKLEIAVVHNGIIENFKELKEELITKGHTFRSQTDSEVLAHLIEEFYNTTLEDAVCQAVQHVKGTFGIAVISSREPRKLVGARHGSPLVVGLGEHQKFIASDPTALAAYTNKVIYLDDNEMVVLTEDDFHTFTLDNKEVDKTILELDFTEDAIDKKGYPHYMLKEIFEQPEVIQNTFAGRLNDEFGTTRLGGLNMTPDELYKIKHIKFIACGTSWHAGLLGRYLIEDCARIPVGVEYASEFRYRNPILPENTLVFVISQSGETADTLAALREAKQKGARVLGIVNAVSSTIARETDGGIYVHAGPEIGVASTKAFTSQLMALIIFSTLLARMRDLSSSEGRKIVQAIKKIPDQIHSILAQNDHIRDVAQEYCRHSNALYLGRGYNYPIALEGALKMKEISYIHAEGYPAAEMKHGPIALIDENMPVVTVVPQDSVYDKVISNIEEVRARKGRVLAIASEGDKKIKELADHVIYIPHTLETLTPILSVIPLQLLAYHTALMRGCNVDQPRNLAKSVTVE